MSARCALVSALSYGVRAETFIDGLARHASRGARPGTPAVLPPGAIHGDCDKPIAPGAEINTDCTITYEGKPAVFHVNGYAGSVLVQYTVSQTTAVLGGIGVMHAWYRTVLATAPSQVGTAKCDASLPKAEPTSFGVQPYRCWYTAADGANVEKKVDLTEKGPAFDDEPGAFEAPVRLAVPVPLRLRLPADGGRSSRVGVARKRRHGAMPRTSALSRCWLGRLRDRPAPRPGISGPCVRQPAATVLTCCGWPAGVLINVSLHARPASNQCTPTFMITEHLGRPRDSDAPRS
jgi:hypothetical protein